MPDESQALLKDAIARNAAALLSLPSAGMVRHHKTRFLGESPEGFWVESATDDGPLLNALMAEQAPVGIAFKSGQTSVSFMTPIRTRRADYPVNDHVAVEALLLPFPNTLRPEQRRQAYRVVLPTDHDVKLRLWRMSERAALEDRPMMAQEVPCRLADISVSGLRALCKAGTEERPLRIATEERLRILLGWRGEELLTEGRVMHVRSLDDGGATAGVHFKKLEQDLVGRQTLSKLTKLVGELQRAEIKRR
jgi:c-di-GMP-binding flagellar brake protein YcgR